VAELRNGKVLAYKCKRCSNLQIATTIFCNKCSSQELDATQVKGEGKIITYSIQNVAPEEYEKYKPYAWVVVKLDAGFNISGLLPGIDSPKNLPINTKVIVVNYDERGIVLSLP
jgi:uncharacterized OB-fold protein